jgi:hypothetical protein
VTSGPEARISKFSEGLEDKNLVCGWLKRAVFRMDVPIPKESEPNVGVKEIQRVHKSVRS